MKKYIYLDTKIKGAVTQLASYFKHNVFDSSFTVLYRRYKENKAFLSILDKDNIPYMTFRRYKDLPSLDESIIFYLFNAQSNCRIVAYREAKHIFVTHGESNKLPSIKPILRIYDHVIVAGDAGKDRLLNSKIFSNCDVNLGKVIRMGNTFIGNANYQYDENSKTVLYAPTWEGGIEEENYCSISKDGKNFESIAKYMAEQGYTAVVIQIHPNLGHRDPRYLYYLYSGIGIFDHYDIDVKIRKVDLVKAALPLKFYFKYKNFYAEDETLTICEAFCDVSAIEAQLLDKEIPTRIFFNGKPVAMPKQEFLFEYYQKVGIYNNLIKPQVLKNIKEIKAYYLTYEPGLDSVYIYDRKIKWLLKKVTTHGKI